MGGRGGRNARGEMAAGAGAEPDWVPQRARGSPWASACREGRREQEGHRGKGRQHRGSLRRAAPCWPWLSGVAGGRKDAAAGAKDTLRSGNSRSLGDEDQQPREAVTPLPARKETSKGLTGHGSGAAKAEGARAAGAGLSNQHGLAPSTGVGLSVLTQTLGEDPCLPASHFRSLQPFPSGQFATRVPSQLPRPPYGPAVPTRSRCRSCTASTYTRAASMEVTMAELAPVAWSPPQPPPRVAAEPFQGRTGRAGRCCCRDRVLLPRLRSLASVQKALGLANSGRQEPGARLPREQGELSPAK